MPAKIKRYMYEGPIAIFEKVVCMHWKAETMAVSKKKAISNLSYRFRKQYGYENVPIKLSGNVIEIESED